MALPTALLVLVVLTLLGTAAVFTAGTEADIAGNGRMAVQPRSLAEAGAHEALARLNMQSGVAPTRLTPGETSPGVPDPDWSVAIVNKAAPGAGEVATVTGAFGSATALDATTVVRYKRESADEMPTAHCDADGCDGEVVLFHTDFGYAGANVPTGASAGRPVVQIEATYTGASVATVLTETVRAVAGANATAAVRACGYVKMQGNASVTAPAGGTAVMAGTTFESQGNASLTPAGAVETGQACPADLFAQTFGMPPGEMKASADIVGAGPMNTPASGTRGKIIYVTGSNATTSWQGNAVIGSATEPVIVVVEGSLRIQGNVRIFGMIYAMKDYDIQGNARIEGAIIAGRDALDLQGNARMSFNPTALGNLKLNGPFSALFWEVD